MNNTQRSINKYKNGQKTGYWNEVVSSNPSRGQNGIIHQLPICSFCHT